MTTDKAARLAAIRTANANKQPVPVAAAQATPPSPQVAAARSKPTETRPLAKSLQLLPLLLFTLSSVLLIAAVLQVGQPLLSSMLPAFGVPTPLALSRASALVGYVLLWLSMVLGLAITSRSVRIWPGGPAALDLHQHLSLLGLLFVIFHVVILLADEALGYTLAKALLPFFGARYRPMWVGLMGKIALYLMLIVWLSYFIRSRLGGRWWRRIHHLSFVIFLLSLAHGVLAGSDTPTVWASGGYLVSALSIVALLIYRVQRTRRKTPAEGRALLRAGALVFDPISLIVTLPDTQQVQLRSSEGRLLGVLIEHAGKILTAEQILVAMWGPSSRDETYLVAYYVRRLCARIEPDPSSPAYIRVIDGQRYCFERPAHSR